MDKELCFFINDDALFLDKVLVAFNDTPIFFVCCDSESDYYLVLCTNIEDLEYIIVKTSLQMIYRILTQKAEMRAPFAEADHFWYVKAGVSPHEDEVEHLEREQMDLDVLPYPKAMYETISADDLAYVDKIKSSYFSESDFVSFEAVVADDEVPKCSLRVPDGRTQSIALYLEFSSTTESPFSGVKKRFECSCSEDESAFIYAEKMEHRSGPSISSDFKKEIPINTMAFLPDAA